MRRTSTPKCENTRRKIDAGAQFLQTQAIYDTELLARYLDAAKLGDVAHARRRHSAQVREDGGVAERQRARHPGAADR